MARMDAIPVKVTTKTLRQMCQESDSEFLRDSELTPEYEFNSGKRKFDARYKHRGAYTED